MNWKLLKFNCFWLLVPILVWNILFVDKLTHVTFAADENVPAWLLIMETIFRVGVFLIPLFLQMQSKTQHSQTGWILYTIGILIYFLSWLPLMIAPESAWSNHVLGVTAPAYTPLLWLLGIGLIGGWWPYLGLSVLFVGIHVSHWVLAFRSVA